MKRILSRYLELVILFTIPLTFYYFDIIGSVFQPPSNMNTIAAALCSVFGSLVGFSIAALGIVFAIIQKPEYDILFKHTQGEDFFHAFKINQFISFLGFIVNGVAMIDDVAKNKYITTVILAIIFSWIFSFIKLVGYFNTLVDAEIKLRKPKT